MPAPVIYAPPPFRRYFACTADPNSAAGGSNLETIGADTVNFPSADIPDVLSPWPVTTATFDWTPSNISRADEVTSQRAAKPDIPFKRQPTWQWTVDSYRWALERALKYGMGAEGAITGAGPYLHPISALGFGGAVLQPSMLVQDIRDGINRKGSGVVVESVDVTFPFGGVGTVNVAGHALYARTEPASTSIPTGVIIEPAALPLVVRDALVVYDGGATNAISVSQFTFGFKNNGNYDRQVAGHCIDTLSIGATPILRQLWFPHYHKLSARQTVTWGLEFLDTQQAQEVANEWGQIQKIVVTLAEPNVAGNQIVFNLFATEIEAGGVSALTATGDQTSSFTGNAAYSSSDGTDVTVNVSNAIATAIV